MKTQSTHIRFNFTVLEDKGLLHNFEINIFNYVLSDDIIKEFVGFRYHKIPYLT